MIKYIGTFLLIFMITQLIAQPGDFPTNREPGKCYAKCQILDVYEEQEETFRIYTKTRDKKIELDSVYFTINEDGDWIYVGFENELTTDQIENEDELERIVFLTDRTETNDYVEETISYKRLIKKGGIEWREVLCAEKINSRIFMDVQKALVDKGYLKTAKPIVVFTHDVKIAVRAYQRDHNLPLGQLDIETLNSLGIIW